MTERLEKLEKEISAELKGAAGKQDVLGIKTKYLGRKGEFASLIKDLANLPPPDRRRAGEAINRVKKKAEQEISELLEGFQDEEKKQRLTREKLDVTLPGRRERLGRTHPITQVLEEVIDIFTGLGFEIAEGPEVELDYYNFEALNIPKDHPARDMQDTFYIVRGLEHTEGPSCKRHAGYILYRPRRLPPYPHLTRADKGDGKAPPSSKDNRPGHGLPPGL
jgi:phenylalanyl-tRNA synthetase alpha chain